MAFKPGKLFTHTEDGGVYKIVERDSLMKHPDTGEWLPAVVYKDVRTDSEHFGRVYTTTEERWCEKFRVWQAPDVG